MAPPLAVPFPPLGWPGQQVVRVAHRREARKPRSSGLVRLRRPDSGLSGPPGTGTGTIAIRRRGDDADILATRLLDGTIIAALAGPMSTDGHPRPAPPPSMPGPRRR